MKQLTLDIKTWRCGGEGENRLGDGKTLLLNNKGFMCCLGQFSLQLNSTLKPENILDKAEPNDLSYEIPSLTEERDERFKNTFLSTKAMEINDDVDTTSKEKIEELQNLFWEKDYEIIIVNENLLDEQNINSGTSTSSS